MALLEGLGVDALGINCGLGPVQMKPIVEELLRYASIPVVVIQMRDFREAREERPYMILIRQNLSRK